MGSHALRSPSGFFQIELCAGSHNAQIGLPNVNSEPSIRGTAAHKMLEMVIQGNKAIRDQQTLVVANDPDVGGTTELKPEDTASVRTMLDYLDSIPGMTQLQTEQKVDPGDFVLRDDMQGSLDVQAEIDFLGELAIEIADFKNGFVRVEVQGNSQLIIYMLGVIAERMKDEAFVPDDYVYRTTIVQPQAYHPLGPIRSAEYTYSELLKFADKYRADAAASDEPDAPRTPGTKQCRYCRAKLTCKEFNRYALSCVQGGLPDPRIAPEVTLEEALLRHPKTLSLDQLRMILDNAPLIKAFVKAVEEYAYSAYRSGLRNFGYKLVAGQGMKSWKEDDKDVKKKLLTLANTGGVKLKESDITNPAKLATPTQLIQRLKTQVDEETFAQINKLIKYGNKKAKLVPSTDSAPALELDVADYFETPKPEDDLMAEFFND